MSLPSNKASNSQRGFTIVELLIVVVIIGILSAIVIVAYNGVTSRANTAAAQSAASTLAKKLEAYNAENSTYPVTAGTITAAGTYNSVVTSTSSSWYAAQGTAFTTQTGALTVGGVGVTPAPATSNAKYVWYIPVSTTYGSNGGGCVYYYDFAASGWKSTTVGQATCATTGSAGTAVAI